MTWTAFPCTEAHQYEVFAIATHEGDGTFPPDTELEAIFVEVCEPAFEPYVGAPYATSKIYPPEDLALAPPRRRATRSMHRLPGQPEDR